MRQSILCQILFGLLIVSHGAMCAIKQVPYESALTLQCRQWEVVDIQFEAGREAGSRIFFGAELTGPSGQRLRVPGVFNGGQSFLLRLSVPDTGRWQFETFSSLSELAGNRGEIQVSTAKKGQRGPLTVQPENPQYFYYADGTSCFVLAYELDWLFALDADNSHDLTQTRKLIQQIADYGFNHIVMNVYAYDVGWEKDAALKPVHDFASPQVYPFGGSHDNPDFSKLNVSFFKHLDQVIHLLDEAGLVSHLMIYVWNKQVTWPEMYSEADNRYFDYVIARYQAFPNIVWDISKEALGYGRCDMTYINERIERVRRQDAYKRLLTVHDYAYCRHYPEKVDFISIQTWTTDLYHDMLKVRERHSGQPIFNIEHGGYESSPYQVFSGDYTDSVVCLERNYDCVFAGGYSTYYWQATSWYVIMPDPMGLPQKERPKFEYYRTLHDLFQQYSFDGLKPASGMSTSGRCLTDGMSRFLYCIPEESEWIHVTLPDSVQTPMAVKWFNPLTGKSREDGVQTIGKWKGFKVQWPNQMNILILEGHSL